MAVTDLRDLFGDASSDSAAWVDDGGATTPAAYTESTPPGVSSVISDKISNTLDGQHHDDSTPTGGAFADGDTIYIWWNTIFGSVNTIENGGVRMCFSDGAPLTNFFEVYIGGSNTGKTGWQLTAVNIGKARANPDNTGGSAIAASAIEQIGIRWDITANVSGNNDNTAIGSIYRQTAAQRSVRVDGTTETWATIASASLSAGDGLFVADSNGTIRLNGSIAFGPTTNVNFTFDDPTGRVLAFEDFPFIEDSFYQLQMDLPGGYSSTANLTAGTKTGSGASASGANGWSITTGGPLWRLLMDDADQTAVGFYGSTFQGSGDFEIDDPAFEMISTVVVNCGTIEITGNATASSMARLLNNTFANCPGPRAQVVWLNETSPSVDGFNGNAFTGMLWFGMEIGAGMTGNFSFEMRDNTFSGNGTNRDLLASNDVGTLTVNTNTSLQGTNGTTVIITMVGTIDRFAFTVITYEDVSDTDGAQDQNNNNAPLVTQATASLTVDEDTFAIAASTSPRGTVLGTLTYTGASDQYTDDKLFTSDVFGLLARIGLDEVTPSAGTRTGFPVHSVTEVEAVNAIIHVNEFAASTAVAKIDPEFRPWAVVEAGSTVTFGYGAAQTADHANVKMFVIVVALDDATAANTAISSIAIDTGGGTQVLTSRLVAQDDNISGPGNSLELSIFDLHEAVDTTEQGAGLTIVANPVTTLIHVDDETGTSLQNARVLAEAADGTGIFPFQETPVAITNTTVTAEVEHTGHGLDTGDTIVVRGANEDEYNGPFIVTVTDANNYTYTMDSDPGGSATGTITLTGAFLQGLTDGSGNISFARVVGTDTPIRGAVRKSTGGATRYKSFSLLGNTVDNVLGLTVNVRMVVDE